MVEENFRKRLFPRFPKNDENYKKIFSPAFFNILKEPLQVQKQMLHRQKALDLTYLELEGKGLGSIMKVPRLFGAKCIFC
jgi:hypothetical protein